MSRIIKALAVCPILFAPGAALALSPLPFTWSMLPQSTADRIWLGTDATSQVVDATNTAVPNSVYSWRTQAMYGSATTPGIYLCAPIDAVYHNYCAGSTGTTTKPTAALEAVQSAQGLVFSASSKFNYAIDTQGHYSNHWVAGLIKIDCSQGLAPTANPTSYIFSAGGTSGSFSAHISALLCPSSGVNANELDLQRRSEITSSNANHDLYSSTAPTGATWRSFIFWKDSTGNTCGIVDHVDIGCSNPSTGIFTVFPVTGSSETSALGINQPMTVNIFAIGVDSGADFTKDTAWRIDWLLAQSEVGLDSTRGSLAGTSNPYASSTPMVPVSAMPLFARITPMQFSDFHQPIDNYRYGVGGNYFQADDSMQGAAAPNVTSWNVVLSQTFSHGASADIRNDYDYVPMSGTYSSFYTPTLAPSAASASGGCVNQLSGQSTTACVNNYVTIGQCTEPGADSDGTTFARFTMHRTSATNINTCDLASVNSGGQGFSFVPSNDIYIEVSFRSSDPPGGKTNSAFQVADHCYLEFYNLDMLLAPSNHRLEMDGPEVYNGGGADVGANFYFHGNQSYGGFPPAFGDVPYGQYSNPLPPINPGANSIWTSQNPNGTSANQGYFDWPGPGTNGYWHTEGAYFSKSGNLLCWYFDRKEIGCYRGLPPEITTRALYITSGAVASTSLNSASDSADKIADVAYFKAWVKPGS